MANVLWLQGGACSGNTISFLNAEEPTVCDLISDFGINLLWHPSLGLELGDNLQQLLRDCISGAKPLDIFVFEDALIGTPIADSKDPVEVGHVARSFDSCLVCTVHAHDAKTGEELARFRTS